jgi:hypothetical protein
MMADVSDVIWELLRLSKDPTLQWITESPSIQAAPEQIASQHAKSHFLGVLTEAASKEAVQAALKEFSRLFS